MPANARILLVGAGPSSSALGDRLRGLGHAVRAAAVPEEAAGQAAAFGPDLVLTDLDGDPARAGVGAAERCGAPVVFLAAEAGDAGDDLLVPGRMTVPYGFVFKPAGPRQLRLCIHGVLAAQARERAAGGRQADAELRRQRGLMRAVLDGIPDGVAAIDLRGNRLLVNRVARSLVDLDAHPADEPLDRRVEAYGVYLPDGETRYPSEDLPIRRALRGEAFTGVEMFMRNPQLPRGRLFSVSGGPVRDEAGTVQAGVLVLHDVTEERRREAAFKRLAAELHNRAQLMDTAFENMSDGVLVTNLAGQFTLFNRGARRLLGIGYSDVPASERPARYGFFHPDRVTPFAEEDLPLMRAIRGESTDNVEMFVQNPGVPDGVFVSVDGRPLRDDAGKLRGGVAVIRDVTLRAAAEEALTQAFSNGRLEVVDTIVHNIGNAVNSVAVGADTLRGELRQNALIGRLSALADAVEAHLDDPVAWLRDDPQGGKALPFVVALARDFAAHYDRLLHTADRVHDRVRHIVDIIRTQKSQSAGRDHVQAVDLRQQIGHAVEVLREPLARRGIRVEIDCARAPREIRTHESRFQQMMVNLVRNAMEAIGERADRGGFGAGEAPRLEVAAYVESAHLVIDVIDNGVGIPPDRLRSIFAAGRTTKAGGSGLGLHSAANFVIGAGGSIRALSEGAGRGATVRVALRLPARGGGDGGGGAVPASAPEPRGS